MVPEPARLSRLCLYGYVCLSHRGYQPWIALLGPAHFPSEEMRSMRMLAGLKEKEWFPWARILNGPRRAIQGLSTRCKSVLDGLSQHVENVSGHGVRRRRTSEHFHQVQFSSEGKIVRCCDKPSKTSGQGWERVERWDQL